MITALDRLDKTNNTKRLIGNGLKIESLIVQLSGCVVGKITISGGYDEGDPPVPIPNTEVKPFSAESTWLDTAREDRSPPDSTVAESTAFRCIYSSVAQWQSTRLLTGLL